MTGSSSTLEACLRRRCAIQIHVYVICKKYRFLCFSGDHWGKLNLEMAVNWLYKYTRAVQLYMHCMVTVGMSKALQK